MCEIYKEKCTRKADEANEMNSMNAVQIAFVRTRQNNGTWIDTLNSRSKECSICMQITEMNCCHETMQATHASYSTPPMP